MISYGLHTIEEDDIQAVESVLRTSWLTQGPKIEEFEKKLADYCGAQYALCFNSGTAALHAAYHAVGLKQDDKFITSSMTFAATSNAGLYLGAKPEFIDIEANGNLDLELLPNQTDAKLIVPVHYAGNSVDMPKLHQWAKSRGLIIIEDACHGLGGSDQGRTIGSCEFSEACVFSFHPVKPITTGEGGAVCTNDPEIYRKMQIFRSHGMVRTPELQAEEGPWAYEMQVLGFNYRMTDLSASLGISQLNKIDTFIAQRRQIACQYMQALANCPGIQVPESIDAKHSGWHLFPILCRDRALQKHLYMELKNADILCQVHYRPVNAHPYYQELGYNATDCPKALDFYQRELSLPIYPRLKTAEVEQICHKIQGICHAYFA